MSQIRLVVSDVDGTLVTPRKELTQRSRAAVARLRERGIGFTAVSSRPPFGMRMLIAPLGLALPLAAFNGAALFTPELVTLEQRHLDPTAARAAIELLSRFGIDAWLFTTEHWLLTNPAGTRVELEKRTVQTQPVIVQRFDERLAAAGKIVGVSDDFARLDACEAEARAILSGRATVARSQTYYLDITAPGIDKGVAVARLCARLGIATAETVTLGDMENDVAMFRVSGYSIAMGNAGEAVKRAASATTASNDEDGFAAAVEELILPRAEAG